MNLENVACVVSVVENHSDFHHFVGLQTQVDSLGSFDDSKVAIDAASLMCVELADVEVEVKLSSSDVIIVDISAFTTDG